MGAAWTGVWDASGNQSAMEAMSSWTPRVPRALNSTELSLPAPPMSPKCPASHSKEGFKPVPVFLSIVLGQLGSSERVGDLLKITQES